jgi:crotonobetainyl-CoA:carnitine CoA-transferase CaiB-like acyl-CoA transferase
MTDGLLSGFRALDLTDQKGFVCGKILAAMGVETIKVERPGGDPTRLIPPFLHNERHPEKSLYWLAFNTDKRSITLDLDKPEGRELFKKLVENVDFVLESYAPGYLDGLGLGYEALKQVNPRIIMTSITPFGQTGPYSQYKGSELIASAMSGVLLTNGYPDRPPVREGPDSIYFHGGAAALLGTMMGHFHCQATGEGQQVDVSLQEVAASRVHSNLIVWEFDKRLIKRNGVIRTVGARSTQWIWQCKDGYVFWLYGGGRVAAPTNRAISRWIDDDGLENPLRTIEKWEEHDMATVPRAVIEAHQGAIARFFLNHTKKEIAEEGLKRGIEACTVNTPADLLNNNHLKVRDYWTDIESPDPGRTVTVPGRFFLSTETQNPVRRRAPHVGEDTAEVLRGLEKRPPDTAQNVHTASKEQCADHPEGGPSGALAGLKVLDFGWAIAGASATKFLGDYGATVIRVESMSHLDIARSNRAVSMSTANNPDDKPWFTHLNTSKYGMSLDLRNPRARGIIEKLIGWADVINANFAPGTLDKLDLGYRFAKSIKPDIIMAEASVYGQSGPLTNQRGIDGSGAALSGYLDQTGWLDRGPVGPNVPYGDSILPLFIGTAIVSAVDYRRRTGKGQYIDASMFELCIHQNTTAVLDWELNGHLQARSGNRIAYAAPHGVFPCVGDDRWCVIAVFADDEWKSFCAALGNPPWSMEERFATLDLRKMNEDALEALVSEWTAGHRAEDVMEMLQAAGVPAGVVQSMEDIVDRDPHLKAREFMIPLKHPVIGVFGHPNPPFKLTKTPPKIRTSPCLGQHNECICTGILGMSDEEFVELVQQGVFE